MEIPSAVLILSPVLEQRESLRGLFVEKGIEARTADSAYRLIAEFARQPADAVLLDLQGQNRRSLEMLSVLREMSPRVGIIVLAGSEEKELAAESLRNGADLYLIKPLQNFELLEALDRVGLRRRLDEVRHFDAIRRTVLQSAEQINTHLSLIITPLQLLLEDRSGDANLSRELRSIEEQANHLADVNRRLFTTVEKMPAEK